MDESSLEDWFVREILCHEAALTRYIRRVWPHSDDVPDICHDAYLRVFEAAIPVRPQAPRSFLFVTARHLMADRARRSRIVSMDLVEDLDALNVLIDDVSPERRLSARQQLQHLSAAFNGLPPKCREVVWLQRVECLSQREIGSRLGIEIGTVQKHALKGIRQLAAFFYGGETPLDRMQDEERSSEDESSHGN
jgi:RNA polymerase sigma-70 factor (ECF subfamily)